VIGSGIQAGALLMVLYGLCPTLRQLPVPEWMRLHVSLDRSIERYMPALNLITGGVTLILLFLPQDPEVRFLRVLALAHNIALAVISEAVNVRLNKQIASRVPEFAGPAGDGLPDDERDHLSDIRARWIKWHGIRTAVIAVGFVQYVVAVLLNTC